MKEFILYILIYLRTRLKMLRTFSCKPDMMTWWLYLKKFTMSLQLGALQERQSKRREKSM